MSSEVKKLIYIALDGSRYIFRLKLYNTGALHNSRNVRICTWVNGCIILKSKNINEYKPFLKVP